MSDDTPTAELTDGQILRALAADMREVKERLSAIEQSSQNGGTRPLLDKLIKEMTQTRDTLNDRLTGVEKELRAINHQLEAMAVHWLKTQGDIRDHAERLADLERRPN
jgi:septal ring factor EnvC (AmiA/AmiB activator)